MNNVMKWKNFRKADELRGRKQKWRVELQEQWESEI